LGTHIFLEDDGDDFHPTNPLMDEGKYLLGLGEILIWLHVLSASKSGNDFFYWLVCPLPQSVFPKTFG
jgi:hypothetical protein